MSISSDLSLISAMASRLALDIPDFSPNGKFVSVESLILFADLLRSVRKVNESLNRATVLYPAWGEDDDTSADEWLVPFPKVDEAVWEVIPYEFIPLDEWVCLSCPSEKLEEI